MSTKRRETKPKLTGSATSPVVRTHADDGVIELRGVRVHNLQGIDLDLPRGQLIVICGVSGSGKSSLAIDTLFTEGQRRYFEGFSVAARQLLARTPRPAADRITGLPPAISMGRMRRGVSDHVTVGSRTEILDLLRLLFTRFGQVYCPHCGRMLANDTPDSVAEKLQYLPDGTKFLVGFPAPSHFLGDIEAIRAWALSQGVVRWIRQQELRDLEEDTAVHGAEPDANILLILDRLTAPAARPRLRSSLEGAFDQGTGVAAILAAMSPGTSLNDFKTSWFTGELFCPPCQFHFPPLEPRLLENEGPLSKSIRVREIDLPQLANWPLEQVMAFLEQFGEPNARTLIVQIQERLTTVRELGLGYLRLDRAESSLSHGELQRVGLAAALGSSLVRMLYVLDEPSVGMHPEDLPWLINSVSALRDRGNTVVLVDHLEQVIRAADEVIEIGPAAGDAGGRIVFQGTPSELLAPGASLTGEYLARRRGVSVPEQRRPTSRGWVRLKGARGANLKSIDVAFPLGVLCLLTGVSGSGKSALLAGTLYPALGRRKQKQVPMPLPFDEIVGDGQFDDVQLLDQAPLGRGSRSNAATMTKAFDEIRDVYAGTLLARTRNLKAGQFSFNAGSGRCAACEGEGTIEVDMLFLADVRMVCGECEGRRYRRDILDVLYRGKSIADVLEMTVRQAFGFFRGEVKVQQRLQPLLDVGLEYLRLGQPMSTLSGGEAQRLKLATFLSGTRRDRTLFLLDEPTRGLHFSDVVVLLDCLQALLNVGHSVIVADHNVQLMKGADYLIDLGPGAGERGGQVVVFGTPEEVAKDSHSATGRTVAREL